MAKKLEQKTYGPTGVRYTVWEDGVIEVFYKRATESLEENDKETAWIRDRFSGTCESDSGKKEYFILLDVRGPGSSEQLSEEAKQIYVDLLRDDRIKKVAVFGPTWGFQLIVDLLAAISRTRKLRSFSDREKAVAWLKKK